MKNSEVLIEFKNIKKIYGKGANETFALNGVDLKIHKGEFVAIMGASGSGKSTSMNIIGCLDKPSSGEYLFDGVNVVLNGGDQSITIILPTQKHITLILVEH
jgi:putative ABC transport system ATP-binding protein